MNFFKFIGRHKIWTSIFIAFLIMTFAVLIALKVLSPYYALGCTIFTSDSAETLSIAFDKPEMMKVNKVEIETPKGITVIEDLDFVKEIVNNTMVATHSGLNAIYGHYFIRLYCDEILIRNMDLSLYGNSIRVYRQDEKHFFLYHHEESGGQVSVSEQFIETMQRKLQEDGNGFGGADGSYSNLE